LNTSTVSYEVEGKEMRGFLAYQNSDSPRPGIIIAHAWRGLDDFARQKAIELAEMGYVGFAADVYGDGINAHNDEESMALMIPLFEDRSLLQARIGAAVEYTKGLSQTDSSKLGAIGFCFGGLTALELLRSGADVQCIVSFHALLSDALGEVKAKRPPKHYAKNVSALFLHGHDDPMVSETDVHNLLYELDENHVDWQFHIYGHTMHAFTNPEANDSDQGISYQPKSARRSWQAMKNFLQEQFQSEEENR